MKLTWRLGSLPQEYVLAYSSPAILLHQRVCAIHVAPSAAASIQASSRPMSRRHSRAAAFVMCAHGVSAVVAASPIIMPFRPAHESTGCLFREELPAEARCRHENLPCEPRKHASAAPAGPAPKMRNSVSTGSAAPVIYCRHLLVGL